MAPNSSSSTMEAFVQTVRLKSFSAAARRHGQSPSAIARQVSALERELGVQLLLRSTRSLELTDAGRTLYGRAADILEQIACAKREAAASSKEVRGTVRLTCWPTLGKRLVLPCLPELMENFQALSIDLDFSEMVHASTLELTELAIRVGNQHDTTMIQTKLGTLRGVIVASPAYVAKHGEPLSIGDCVQHKLIDKRHPAPFMGWRCLFPANRSLDAARVLTTDDLQAQSDACTSGIGIAHLPNWVVSERLLSGELVTLLPKMKPISAPIFLLRAHGSAPASVSALARHLAKRLRPVLA
jgi:DNA-binding transcriptional LysR family regulator